MQPYENSTCGVNLIVQVPSSISEAVSKFGENAVLLAAIRQTFYGPWNSAFRKAFVEKLEEFTGVKRRAKTVNGVTLKKKVKGEDVEVLENEGTYLSFLEESGAISAADLQRIGQEIADTIEFKIPDGETSSAPKKEFIQLAKTILASVEAGKISERTGQPITEESVTANLESLNGFSLETLGGFTEEGLARALQIDDKRRKAEAAASLM